MEYDTELLLYPDGSDGREVRVTGLRLPLIPVGTKIYGLEHRALVRVSDAGIRLDDDGGIARRCAMPAEIPEWLAELELSDPETRVIANELDAALEQGRQQAIADLRNHDLEFGCRDASWAADYLEAQTKENTDA